MVQLPLFPTMDSPQAVVDLATSMLPISNQNDMVTLLMTMQNTVLNQIQP